MKKQMLMILLTGWSVTLAAQTMLAVKGGTFDMGNATYSRESPVRSVKLTSFYLSSTPVTNSQYAEFINAYGADTVKEGVNSGQALVFEDSWGVQKVNGIWVAGAGYENYPVVKVTWYGADTYCQYKGGRLPTEAEWEFAAKGGVAQQTFTYSGSNTAPTVAWYAVNSDHLNHAVGLKAANYLGLFDMSGNVYQWCSDWFDRYSSFGVAGESNPRGPVDGVSKVIRGGYRSINYIDLHLTNRESLSPEEGLNFVGFRLAMDQLPDALNNEKIEKCCFYPNPASGVLYLKQSESVHKMDFLDLRGQLIKTIENPGDEVSLSGLPAGFYTLRLHREGKAENTRLIVR